MKWFEWSGKVRTIQGFAKKVSVFEVGEIFQDLENYPDPELFEILFPRGSLRETYVTEQMLNVPPMRTLTFYLSKYATDNEDATFEAKEGWGTFTLIGPEKARTRTFGWKKAGFLLPNWVFFIHDTAYSDDTLHWMEANGWDPV